MSYEDEIWYTGRRLKDLQTYVSFLLISICIINIGNFVGILGIFREYSETLRILK